MTQPQSTHVGDRIISAVLTPTLAVDVRRLAKLSGKTLSAYVRDVLAEYVETHSEPTRIERCILNLDSPSYPPTLDEYRQCGCSSCQRYLERRDAESLRDE